MQHGHRVATARDAVRAILLDLSLRIVREEIALVLEEDRAADRTQRLSRLLESVSAWRSRCGETLLPLSLDGLYDETERMWSLAEALHRGGASKRI